MRIVAANGLVVNNAADLNLARVLARGCWTPVEQFYPRDATGPGWRSGNVNRDGGFDVMHDGKLIGTVAKLTLHGEHSRGNALAALVAARHAGVPVAVGLRALETFPGVKRRMEILGMVSGITVIDDFAHHPTAISATLSGLRQTVGKSRILAVIEPRSNTMKLGAMKAQLPSSLAGADRVFCYTNRLGWNAAEVLAPMGAIASCHENLDELVACVVRDARADDQVLVMSNGGFGGIHQKLLSAFALKAA